MVCKAFLNHVARRGYVLVCVGGFALSGLAGPASAAFYYEGLAGLCEGPAASCPAPEGVPDGTPTDGAQGEARGQDGGAKGQDAPGGYPVRTQTRDGAPQK